MPDARRLSPEAWALIALVAVVAVAGVAYLTRPPDATLVEAPAAGGEAGVPRGPAASTAIPPEKIHEAGSEPPAVAASTGEADVPESRSTVPPDSPSTRDDRGAVAGRRTALPIRTAPSYSQSQSGSVGSGPAGDIDTRAALPRPSAVEGSAGAAGAVPREAAPSRSAKEPGTPSFTAVPGVPGGTAPGPDATGVETTALEPSSSGAARQPATGSSSPSSTSPRGPGGNTQEPASTPLVAMQPSATRVAVGDLVSVLITIDGASNVGHTPFHVLFNPAVLRFVSGEEGGFLASDGQPTAFFAAPTSDGASVVVGLSRLGRVGGVSGSGDLCVLRFEVVGPGSAGLAFSRAKVRDSSNAIVPAIFQPALLTAS